ncbi:MAG: peptidylprolyl isomerase [Bacteroidota bacterium]
MKRNKLFGYGLFLLSFVTLYTGCIPPQELEVITTIDLDVNDSLFQVISNLQDRRALEALLPFLQHQQPTYRYLAARALGSMDATPAIDSLRLLLRDPVDEVRAMAAFALGQTANEAALPALISGFVQDTARRYGYSQRAVLEAVGKCGDQPTLEQLSSVTTYRATDTLLLEGQALGIYRFGLRKITAPVGTRRMVDLTDRTLYPASVRLVAANYLARFQVPLDTFTTTLVNTFETTTEANVRMALAIALGKTQRELALSSLMGQYARERDYRVKCNIIRALSNFPYENCRNLVTEALRDPNEHVARRAVEYLLENSDPQDAAQWWRFAKEGMPTPIELPLYRAANRHLPAFRVETRDAINAELRLLYAGSTDEFDQAQALLGLAEFPWNYRFLFREATTTTSPVVQTAATEGLLQITNYGNFDSFFGLSSRRVKRDLASYFVQLIQTKAPGAVALSAQALRSESIDFKPFVDSVGLLQTVLDALPLPEQIESYNELSSTISYLKGAAEPAPKVLAFNHPIDWSLLGRYGSQPQLQLTTDQGTVTLVLWPQTAPGSVANLLQLAQEGFLKGKAFHRVVPNFVVQGGSPSNDAYGSMDYSIRSEWSPISYDRAGRLGMASAGRDTEGTQFFITHSPTLHLDGRYTVFGQVVEGMETIHAIQEGDVITDAVIVPTANK